MKTVTKTELKRVFEVIVKEHAEREFGEVLGGAYIIPGMYEMHPELYKLFGKTKEEAEKLFKEHYEKIAERHYAMYRVREAIRKAERYVPNLFEKTE